MYTDWFIESDLPNFILLLLYQLLYSSVVIYAGDYYMLELLRVR